MSTARLFAISFAVFTLGIGDLQVEKRSVGSKPNLPDEMPDEIRQAFLTIMNASDTEGFAIHTLHTQYDDEGNPVGQELFELDEHESEGTQKLFAMSGPLLDTLKEGDVLVVDELDARLHPLMTRRSSPCSTTKPPTRMVRSLFSIPRIPTC